MLLGLETPNGWLDGAGVRGPCGAADSNATNLVLNNYIWWGSLLLP